MVKVVSGTNQMNVEVGNSVADVRDALSLLWNFAGDETAEVSANGGVFRSVNDSYVLQDGETLSFSRTNGTKG